MSYNGEQKSKSLAPLPEAAYVNRSPPAAAPGRCGSPARTTSSCTSRRRWRTISATGPFR